MEETTIRLQMSAPIKLMYIVVCAVGFLFALGGLAALAEVEDKTEWITVLLSIVFFGGGSAFVLSLIVRKAGHLRIGADGLFLDTYLVTGFIPWDNLDKAELKTIMLARNFAIRVKDLEAFLESRHTSGPFEMGTNHAVQQKAVSFMFAFKTILPLDKILPFLGLPKLPGSGDDKEVLAYNDKAFSYHVLIPTLWLPDAERVAALIRSSRQAAGTTALPPAAVTPPQAGSASNADYVQPGYKQCPMCAEPVREQARICRYCRYSFEDGPEKTGQV